MVKSNASRPGSSNLNANEEMKRERRRAANRKSASRSRYRELIMLEELQRSVGELTQKTQNLHKENDLLKQTINDLKNHNAPARLQNPPSTVHNLLAENLQQQMLVPAPFQAGAISPSLPEQSNLQHFAAQNAPVVSSLEDSNSLLANAILQTNYLRSKMLEQAVLSQLSNNATYADALQQSFQQSLQSNLGYVVPISLQHGPCNILGSVEQTILQPAVSPQQISSSASPQPSLASTNNDLNK